MNDPLSYVELGITLVAYLVKLGRCLQTQNHDSSILLLLSYSSFSHTVPALISDLGI